MSLMILKSLHSIKKQEKNDSEWSFVILTGIEIKIII